MDTINLTMYAAFKEAVNDFPRGTAVYYQGKKFSYRSFLKKIDRMADILIYKLGIKEGDTVLIAQPNIPDTLILFYAVNKIGAIANMVHPFTPYNQIRNIFEKTNCKVAFLFEQRIAKEVNAYRDFVEYFYVTRIEDYLPLGKRIIYHTFLNRKIRKKLGRWHGKFLGFNYLHNLKPTGQLVSEVSNDSNKTAVLLHSGSTTGDPKTICLNNDSFNFISNHACEFLSVTPEYIRGKAMLSVLPSFHGFGLCMTMHAPMCNRFASALVPKFSPKAVCDVMKHMKLASICGVPTMYEALLKYKGFINNKKLQNMVVCFCGGDSMSASLKKRFDDTMKRNNSICQVFEGYGLTEAIAVNCVNTFEHNKLGSIGYPGSGFDFKILNEKDKEVKRGEIGEICIKSPANMLYYFNDEAATKATFTKDGYLKTGDLGYMDEDNFIFFKQRKKRVVKVSGVGVFPTEIEQLIEHVPGVNKCCAIQIPDPKLVHAIKVFVVAEYFDEEGMKRNIIDTCQKYLIRWAVPKEIEFRKELPLTMLNKVDFRKLQEEENYKRGI